MGQADDRNPRQKRIDFWPIVEPNYGLMSDFPDSDSTRQASALTMSRWDMGYLPTLRVIWKFSPLAKLVVCRTDPERYGLLYELIWRMTYVRDTSFAFERAARILSTRLGYFRPAFAARCFAAAF